MYHKRNVEIKTAPNLKLIAGAHMEGVFYLERLVVSGYYAVCHNQCVTLASLVSKNMQIDPIANCLNTHHLLLSILGASAYESFAPIEIYLFPNVVSTSDRQ